MPIRSTCMSTPTKALNEIGRSDLPIICKEQGSGHFALFYDMKAPMAQDTTYIGLKLEATDCRVMCITSKDATRWIVMSSDCEMVLSNKK